MAIKQTRELERLMQEAFDKKTGVLYMLPNEPPIFSIQNTIERGQSEPFTYGQIKDIATAALGEDALKDIGTETGQLTTLCSLPGIVDARMIVAKSCGNFTITLRFQPTSIPTPKDARIPEAILQAVAAQRGLILFSGPTGCGKTTSLLITLDYLNGIKPCHISTIEYVLEWHLTAKKALVQQHEVGVDVPDTLTGISTSLSQGADVFMIGELRNIEEINLSIMVSQNHLVLTQLHADTPEAAIQRMIDIYPEDSVKVPRQILAEKLRCACAQMLLERADGKGRVAAYGVLVPDDQMRKAIVEDHDIFDRKTPLPDGCRTIAEDIEKLHSEGVINEKIMAKALDELKQ